MRWAETFVDQTLGEQGMQRTQQMVGEIEKSMEKDIRGG